MQRLFETVNRKSRYTFSFFVLHQEHRQLAHEVREFYFGNATINEDSTMTYLEMMSDINMFLNIDQTVKKMAKNSKGNIYYMLYVYFP